MARREWRRREVKTEMREPIQEENLLHFGQLATCLSQEGRWECYCKYMEKNCSTFFLTMQCTYRGHLAVLALVIIRNLRQQGDPVGSLDAEDIAEAVLLYVSRIAFTASLFAV